MPQPLKTLMKGQSFGYIDQMPAQYPELCAAAMNVIASWSRLEIAAIDLITTMLPGNAGPMTDLYTKYKTDTPKRAMLSALAQALMLEAELAVYERLMIRYEASSSLRNPMAHWILGQSQSLRDPAIIATEPKQYELYLAAVKDMARQSQPPLEAADVIAKTDKLLGESSVYRMKDLVDIASYINTTSGYFFELKFILSWRMSDAHPDKRDELLKRLSLRLKPSPQ